MVKLIDIFQGPHDDIVTRPHNDAFNNMGQYIPIVSTYMTSEILNFLDQLI